MAQLHLPNGFTTVFDDEDEALITGFNWRAATIDRYIYVHGWRGRLHVFMHRLIMGAPKGRHVDHRDGDGLNNRRSNLRLATPSQNHANRGASIRKRGTTSRFKGVYFDKRGKRWVAQMMVDRKNRFLGQFHTEEEAAVAYNRGALAAWGEFAKLNDVEQPHL